MEEVIIKDLIEEKIGMILENPDFDNEEFKGKFFTVKINSESL